MASMLQLILFILTINTNVYSTSHIYSNTYILCISSKSCTINCINKAHCTNKTIICPSDQNCNINCQTPYSCQNTTIIGTNSSHLTLHALSHHSTSHSNIHCPLSKSSTCHIYGNSHSTNQWNNMNIHTYTYTNHKLICESIYPCANDKSISLIQHNPNNSTSTCQLSHLDYKCIHTRNLLSTPSTTVVNSTKPHTSSSKSNNSPFSIHMTATQISWILFGAVLLVLLLICTLICLTYFMCKQNKQKHNSKQNIRVNTTTSSDMQLRYLVLAYQDGKKIKIPFDISTLDRLNGENDTDNNTNYLSDSLHAALSDEHNKIISAVLLDANVNTDMEHTNSNNENTENTIIPSLDNISNHSRIEVIMEDDNNNHFTCDDNVQLMVNIGTNNKQRIIQNSMSITNSMDLYGLKKYKTRKDSDININEKESQSNQSTITSSENISHSSEIEMQIENNSDKRRTHQHHQSSSHPQILPPNFKIEEDINRPKTAHRMSPKHIKNIDTNSTQLTSTYNDSEHTNDKYKQYLQNEEIPAMKISASAPNINANRVQINAPKPSRVILPTKTLSPSKKGRRTPKPLPKPQPKKHTHKHNNYLSRPPDMNYSHSLSPQGNHRRNNKNKDRQSNAMQHQMIMQLHHQRHQRTLQPNVNVNGLKMNRHINNPPNVNRNELMSQMNMQYKKRGRKKKKYHRHMSEPSNIMQNMAQYNQFKMNDNNPLAEFEDLVPITFLQGENLSRSSTSRVRSKSHPSKPVKDGESGEWYPFVINNDKSPIPKFKKKKKKHKKRIRKRKSSTPTIKKKGIIRHRQQSGSDKLRLHRHNNKRDTNPFPARKNVNINMNKPKLKVNNDKLRPPLYHKDKHNKYYDNYYYSDQKTRELHNQSSANSNLTLYTATTNSETPIPNEINSNSIITGHSHKKTISMTPINIELINTSINNEFKSRDSNKTTTISSAMVPPPPSPQLNKKYNSNNLSPSPTPSFRLNHKEDRISNNSTVTATYDGGVMTNTYQIESKDNIQVLVGKYDSDSTLSQDTANSGTNKLNTRTPRTERTSNNGSNTETVTYRNLKYSVGSPDANDNDNNKTMFKIRVDNVIDEDINISETNSNTPSTSDDEGSPNNKTFNNNNTNDTETSSPSSSNDGLHTQTHTQTIQKQKHKPLPPPQHNNNKQLTLGKKHYIVGSMDSDKMFIPPVPMTNKNTYNDEYKDIPNKNPYSHRTLRPLPDSASIGTISPDWRQKTHNDPFTYKYNMQDIEYSEYSNNDEEKSFKPKNDSNFTSVLSKHSTSTHPPTFPSITNTHQSSNTHPSSNAHTHTHTHTHTNTHTNNSNRNSNYNDDFEKEYYFHHQLEETIKSLTNKSENGHSDENDSQQFIEPQNFIQIDDDKLWQIRRDINNNNNNNNNHYVE